MIYLFLFVDTELWSVFILASCVKLWSIYLCYPIDTYQWFIYLATYLFFGDVWKTFSYLHCCWLYCYSNYTFEFSDAAAATTCLPTYPSDVSPDCAYASVFTFPASCRHGNIFSVESSVLLKDFPGKRGRKITTATITKKASLNFSQKSGTGCTVTLVKC